MHKSGVRNRAIFLTTVLALIGAFSLMCSGTASAQVMLVTNEYTTDMDIDGNYDELCIEVLIQNSEPFPVDFWVLGTLLDGGLNYIETAPAVWTGMLPPFGLTTVTLIFDGPPIYRYGANGPFNIYIEDWEFGGPPSTFMWYLTNPYAYTDFEAPAELTPPAQ